MSDFNEKPTHTWQEEENLVGDASLIVGAGRCVYLSLIISTLHTILKQTQHSDTTAATLTCLFYHFATHPDVYETLQAEVDALFESSAGQGASLEAESEDPVDAAALAKLPYLQACIDESLRLMPPVPSGLQRQTPPQGLQVGDVWIPGNTIVMTPTYTLNRGESSFIVSGKDSNMQTNVSSQTHAHSPVATNSSQSGGPPDPTSSRTPRPTLPFPSVRCLSSPPPQNTLF